MAGCLLILYYSLYVGLAIYYVIWFAKESVPFKLCAEVRMGKVSFICEFLFLLDKNKSLIISCKKGI